MADGSSKVVYAALAGNFFVAASKFVAAALSGSSAMLTEAIHSTSDCTNQLLLLIGVRRGEMPSDPSHRFGYGMEIYFWTFVVAVLVMLAGGVYSVFRGVSELASPVSIRSPELSLFVLLLSAIFEGVSFSVGYRQYKVVAARHHTPGESVGLIRFIKWSKDPSLYESLLEDGAALAGIAVAALGIVASAYFGVLRADGAASLVIGMILLGNGAAILVATRSLIAGEAVAPPVLRDFWLAVGGREWSDRVSDLATLHLGPSCILIAVTLLPQTGRLSDRMVALELEKRLKAADPRVLDVLIRYGSVKAGAPALRNRERRVGSVDTGASENSHDSSHASSADLQR
jgi:cation diffusion facilitator family transporter